MKDHGYCGMRASVGLVLALEPITVLAAAAVVTAAATVATGTLNYIASQDAADAAKSLKNQQQSELDAQSKAASQQAAAQAVSGQTFGEDPTARSVSTGLGFGKGNAPAAPNSGGRAQLTGMN